MPPRAATLSHAFTKVHQSVGISNDRRTRINSKHNCRNLNLPPEIFKPSQDVHIYLCIDTCSVIACVFYVCMYVCLYVCMYVFIYVCMYVCLFVCFVFFLLVSYYFLCLSSVRYSYIFKYLYIVIRVLIHICFNILSSIFDHII